MNEKMLKLVKDAAIKRALKTVGEIPSKDVRSEMTSSEWFEWFNEEFMEGAKFGLDFYAWHDISEPPYDDNILVIVDIRHTLVEDYEGYDLANYAFGKFYCLNCSENSYPVRWKYIDYENLIGDDNCGIKPNEPNDDEILVKRIVRTMELYMKKIATTEPELVFALLESNFVNVAKLIAKMINYKDNTKTNE